MPNDLILVVDDEETIREIVSSMLSGAHFKTRQAASGIEALAILESGEEFDLVLSDLMMPEMDGIALLERAKERYPDMPIVMVTAVHDIQVALQGAAQWGVRLPAQAFRARTTLATVRRALENRRLKRENDDYRTNLEATGCRPYPAMESRALRPGEGPTTCSSKPWAMRSTSRTPRPNTTPGA